MTATVEALLGYGLFSSWVAGWLWLLGSEFFAARKGRGT
jgi:hypothetical protein